MEAHQAGHVMWATSNLRRAIDTLMLGFHTLFNGLHNLKIYALSDLQDISFDKDASCNRHQDTKPKPDFTDIDARKMPRFPRNQPSTEVNNEIVTSDLKSVFGFSDAGPWENFKALYEKFDLQYDNGNVSAWSRMFKKNSHIENAMEIFWKVLSPES